MYSVSCCCCFGLIGRYGLWLAGAASPAAGTSCSAVRYHRMEEPMPKPDTILAHPALAGRTLLVRHGARWAAHRLDAEGTPGAAEPLAGNPADQVWRTGDAA